jgi:hypothetical protein
MVEILRERKNESRSSNMRIIRIRSKENKMETTPRIEGCTSPPH